MYPRRLLGALLSVDQHAPDRLIGHSSMHWKALTGAPGPLVYLKHELSHPQNTRPFRICSDMFRMTLYNKLKAKQGVWSLILHLVYVYMIFVQHVGTYTGVLVDEGLHYLASIQPGSHYHKTPCCCDLRELKHVQQQHRRRKGLMMRS